MSPIEAVEVLEALVREARDWASQREAWQTVYARMQTENADNERLRALVKAVERVASELADLCPWCGYSDTHADCRAFTPDGKVK